MRVNKIQQLTLAPLLAEAIRRIHEKTSISAIFKKGTVQPKNEKRITIDKGAARPQVDHPVKPDSRAGGVEVTVA